MFRDGPAGQSLESFRCKCIFRGWKPIAALARRVPAEAEPAHTPAVALVSGDLPIYRFTSGRSQAGPGFAPGFAPGLAPPAGVARLSPGRHHRSSVAGSGAACAAPAGTTRPSPGSARPGCRRARPAPPRYTAPVRARPRSAEGQPEGRPGRQIDRQRRGGGRARAMVAAAGSALLAALLAAGLAAAGR